MSSTLRLGEILVKSGVIGAERVREVLGTMRRKEDDLGERLVALGLVDERTLLKTLSRAFRLPAVQLGDLQPDLKALARLNRATCTAWLVFPVELAQNRDGKAVLNVAMANPANVEGIKEVTRQSRTRIRLLVASAREIRTCIARFYDGATEVPDPRATTGEMAALLPPLPQFQESAGASGQLFDFDLRDLSAETPAPGIRPVVDTQDMPAMSSGQMPPGQTPPGQTPPGQTPPGQVPAEQTAAESTTPTPEPSEPRRVGAISPAGGEPIGGWVLEDDAPDDRVRRADTGAFKPVNTRTATSLISTGEMGVVRPLTPPPDGLPDGGPSVGGRRDTRDMEPVKSRRRATEGWGSLDGDSEASWGAPAPLDKLLERVAQLGQSPEGTTRVLEALIKHLVARGQLDALALLDTLDQQ